jgi:hypothetical protein
MPRNAQIEAGLEKLGLVTHIEGVMELLPRGTIFRFFQKFPREGQSHDPMALTTDKKACVARWWMLNKNSSWSAVECRDFAANGPREGFTCAYHKRTRPTVGKVRDEAAEVLEAVILRDQRAIRDNGVETVTIGKTEFRFQKGTRLQMELSDLFSKEEYNTLMKD